MLSTPQHPRRYGPVLKPNYQPFVSERVRYMLSPVRPSSVCLSCTLLEAVQIFRNISTALGTLAILDTFLGLAKCSDFGPIDVYIANGSR